MLKPLQTRVPAPTAASHRKWFTPGALFTSHLFTLTSALKKQDQFLTARERAAFVHAHTHVTSLHSISLSLSLSLSLHTLTLTRSPRHTHTSTHSLSLTRSVTHSLIHTHTHTLYFFFFLSLSLSRTHMQDSMRNSNASYKDPGSTL